MNIIVCLKQVPDTTELKIDPVTGTLIRKGVPSIINPDDKNALEEALKLKDKYEDVKITVLSMGPAQAEEALREALAMGADDTILLSDRAFGGADTWATSETLAAAIRKIGNYDIIFAGRQAIDGDTAQVGPQIAERLNLPQVTYVQSFDIKDGKVTVKRALEDGYEIIEVNTPVLLTTIKELNTPRYMSVNGIFTCYGEGKYKVWGLNDIDVDVTNIGLKGSPTQVKKSFTPEQKGAGEILKGTTKEVTTLLVSKLKEKHLI
ncbi:MAG: electron transfer flavoprotein subunit beta/FixA family protein [Thermotogae bacterium]|nr:electron transfer flavoprotein subunit beta/FixA family protein [Thermotogota bacterium]